MVQMKAFLFSEVSLYILFLYIPHGSDERQHKKDNRKALFMSLYPTWFRWKAYFLCYFFYHWLTLYPTWFRWKVGGENNEVRKWNTLYPTWFRWKRLRHIVRNSEDLLYIPHGSDESYISITTDDKSTRLYIPHGSDERYASNAW